ncbi:MAG: hypothetical protein K6E89_01060 [Sphaerochaetaceae bacterium]|nr:hypothetical protein [Sphaerochaetaceae bacterium]
MFSTSEVGYYLYFLVMGLAAYYLYKAIKQIKTKDMDFFKKEIYTDESVEKWAVRDGFLKIGAGLAFGVYGGLGLVGINILYITIGVLAVLVALYFFLYSKTLVKKEEY